MSENDNNQVSSSASDSELSLSVELLYAKANLSTALETIGNLSDELKISLNKQRLLEINFMCQKTLYNNLLDNVEFCMNALDHAVNDYSTTNAQKQGQMKLVSSLLNRARRTSERGNDDIPF